MIRPGIDYGLVRGASIETPEGFGTLHDIEVSGETIHISVALVKDNANNPNVITRRFVYDPTTFIVRMQPLRFLWIEQQDFQERVTTRRMTAKAVVDRIVYLQQRKVDYRVEKPELEEALNFIENVGYLTTPAYYEARDYRGVIVYLGAE
jgi:hypothetical protein